MSPSSSSSGPRHRAHSRPSAPPFLRAEIPQIASREERERGRALHSGEEGKKMVRIITFAGCWLLGDWADRENGVFSIFPFLFLMLLSLSSFFVSLLSYPPIFFCFTLAPVFLLSLPSPLFSFCFCLLNLSFSFFPNVFLSFYLLISLSPVSSSV